MVVLKVQAIDMVIAFVTMNRKVNQKPRCIQEETFGTESNFFYYVNHNKFGIFKANKSNERISYSLQSFTHARIREWKGYVIVRICILLFVVINSQREEKKYLN